MKLLHIGCGKAPIQGAVNIDNSFSLLLSRLRLLYLLLEKTGFLSGENIELIDFYRKHKIKYGNALRLKYADNSIDIIYTSHMLEHLTREELKVFLRQASRILKPGGILRIVIPDMRRIIDDYSRDGDMDRLIERSLLVNDYGNSLKAKLKYVMFGWRGHQWMYDEASFLKLLKGWGFQAVMVLKPGETHIRYKTNINLCEKSGESLYFECIK